MDKPTIAVQLDGLAEDVRRVIAREYRGVLCFGPAGIGKSVTVEAVLRHSHSPYVKPNNVTKHGVYELLRAHAGAILWLDDYDEWLHDLETVTLFKAVLDKRPAARTFQSFNRDTIREGRTILHSDVRLIVTSNADLDSSRSKMRTHIRAIEDRCARADISHDLKDRLDYIDWLICEQDYFRSPLLHRIEHLPPLSLGEIQDVLDWLHEHAAYVRLSLRLLNDVARERRLHPDGWKENMRRRLLSKPQTAQGISSIAPRVQGWNSRRRSTHEPAELLTFEA